MVVYCVVFLVKVLMLIVIWFCKNLSVFILIKVKEEKVRLFMNCLFILKFNIKELGLFFVIF